MASFFSPHEPTSATFKLFTFNVLNLSLSSYNWRALRPCSGFGFDLRECHQFSSVAQWCLTLCEPMDCSMLGFPVHHQLPELNSNSCSSSQWCHQTISSSVIPFFSCLHSFPALEFFPMSQLLHQVAIVLEFQLQHQSFQWIFRTDFL